MTKTIEYICTGNNGRSPISRAIAKKRLEEIGAEDYDTISSGTMVDSILAGKMSVPLKKTALISGVDQGLESIIYTQDRARSAITLVSKIKGMSNEEFEARYQGDQEFKTTFNQYAELSRQYFATQENQHCIATAKELGVAQYLDSNFKQTTPKQEVIAVLPMAQSNLDQAKKIYAGQEPAIMEVVSKFVNGAGAIEVPNTFGKPAQAYQAMVQTLQPIVIASVDQIVAMYK